MAATEIAAVFLTITLALLPPPAMADTAEEMATACAPYRAAEVRNEGDHQMVFVPAPTMDSEVCWGAFTAFQQLAVIALYPHKEPSLEVCLPPNGGRVELIKVFLKYVEDHPEKLHENFALVLLQAMWKAFPCPHSPK